MRKTKIICTLGPATEKTETLRKLIQKGSDVFRLNMSHASHDWVRDIVPRIRMLAQKVGRPVALLLDTQGPAIRTDDLTVGNTILVDNGLIKLLVLEKGRNCVLCKVLTRAILGSRRHINLPGVHVNLPSLTRKDLADVALGVEIG